MVIETALGMGVHRCEQDAITLRLWLDEVSPELYHQFATELATLRVHVTGCALTLALRDLSQGNQASCGSVIPFCTGRHEYQIIRTKNQVVVLYALPCTARERDALAMVLLKQFGKLSDKHKGSGLCPQLRFDLDAATLVPSQIASTLTPGPIGYLAFTFFAGQVGTDQLIQQAVGNVVGFADFFWFHVTSADMAITSIIRRRAESYLSLIHISEPTRLLSISYAVFCLKKKK
eukprot:TRINITY_DN45763_c0_g1_i2.p1 TRINITY_DN45763_c0_g1~~TRINITY_DN45763_c0_g1_i2.p1  ORF type:complete len:233 (+),score=54.32 TRINITY_DN45763_c0_g1_i2:87-785(+)